MSSSEDNRVDAVHALIRTLHAQYPQKGFTVSDKIEFIHNDKRGLCLRAKSNIQFEETLMVVPESSRLCSTDFINSDKKYKALRKQLMQNRQRQQLQMYLAPEVSV